MRYLPLLLFSICLIITACKKKNDELIPDSYAWIDKYTGRYNVVIKYHTAIYGSNFDTVYNDTGTIRNLRISEHVFNDTSREVMPMVEFLYKKPNGTINKNRLYVKSGDWQMEMFDFVISGTIKSEYLSVANVYKYSPHGYSIYTIEGTKAK